MRPGPQVSSLLVLVKVFLIFGTALGLFFHIVTTEPMPWWPDTVIVGSFMGTMAVLVVVSRRLDRRGLHHLRYAARATRLLWRR